MFDIFCHDNGFQRECGRTMDGKPVLLTYNNVRIVIFALCISFGMIKFILMWSYFIHQRQNSTNEMVLLISFLDIRYIILSA